MQREKENHPNQQIKSNKNVGEGGDVRSCMPAIRASLSSSLPDAAAESIDPLQPTSECKDPSGRSFPERKGDKVRLLFYLSSKESKRSQFWRGEANNGNSFPCLARAEEDVQTMEWAANGLPA